jgi:hypothetical protein
MTSVRRTRRIAPTISALVFLGLVALPVLAHAQANDRLVNASGHAVKYRQSGASTWLLLNPGGFIDLTTTYDLLNESFLAAPMTMQRLGGTVYSTSMTINMDPGAQGTVSSQGVICTVGRFVVTQFMYTSQYIGNLYGRALLSPLSAPARGNAPRGDDHQAQAINPVVTVWGYESYNGTSSRLEMTTMDQIRTGGYVSLVGSTDDDCTTGSYIIEFQGEYINWDNTGKVTSRTMPCANSSSFPLVHPIVLIAMIGALGAGAAAAARTAQRPRSAPPAA